MNSVEIRLMAVRWVWASWMCCSRLGSSGWAKLETMVERAFRCSNHSLRALDAESAALLAADALSPEELALRDDFRPAEPSECFFLRPLPWVAPCPEAGGEAAALAWREAPLSWWTRLMWSLRFHWRGNP